MTAPRIYGIKNCDTMKKARRWLDEHGVTYEFHDYKAHGADKALLEDAIKTHGWDNVINRRGTSWRKLPDELRAGMNAQSALTAALENPSLIKRPLLLHNGRSHLGFDETHYQQLFG